jgi:superfamily I DNA/RNA helicase
MRTLKRARKRARVCRDRIGASREQMLGRVEKYLYDAHQIELIAANAEFLRGGRAEVVPAEGCLYYDERFDRDPAEKLMLVLHELGHMELHPRLKRLCTAGDPLAGSIYLNDGGPAMARYNRRSREEAEANAFATEFLCPSGEVFERWTSDAGEDSATLAEFMGAPVGVVQAQLAEALYLLTLGGDAAKKLRHEFDCDPVQEEAAQFTGAPALVDAGPGTGKTATLVRRIEYLITELGAAPDSILVLTFSTEAAEELTERIEQRLGSNIADEITVNTFHGFGVSFLLQHGQFSGVDANAYILDEAGQAELVSLILGKADCEKILDIKNPQNTVDEVVRHISFMKDRLRSPDTLAAELAGWEPDADELDAYARSQEFLGIFRAYEQEKALRKRLDFADLITLPIEILGREKAVRDARRRQHQWVLVDEYQDVSRSVARLLQLLCGPNNPPWVVGDMRQAIFQFRGAARENVSEFPKDFPGAKLFELNINYRSSVDIVRAANQLADLLELPAQADARDAERWQASPANPDSVGDSPVAVAVANSDQAEHEGVGAQAAAWLEAGVSLGDIAVLARRNIDVRNIVLALGRLGVRATTSGLVTAEGAAGDLANLLTVAHRAHASLPRLAFSLGRDRYDTDIINSVIKRLIETIDEDGEFALTGYGDGDDLAVEVDRACGCLREGRHAADAFTAMCLFLFDGSDYLRRLLSQPDGVERSLAVGEIVASLSRAAVYRFTHQGTMSAVARKAFGEYFRAALNSSVPCLMPPPSNVKAVRVMTCHASKGLEFPCVVVAGQTLSRATKGYKWLPDSLQPPDSEDIDQANSVAFVGATRAQRALLVTYATTASGAAGAVKRAVTPLIEKWRAEHGVPTAQLPAVTRVRESASTGALWGGELDAALPARSLDKGQCPIKSYLLDVLGAHYPVNEEPLYKIFHAVTRYCMRQVIERAHEIRAPVGVADALDMFMENWAASEVGAHPHYPVYTRIGVAYVERLARAYVPPRGNVEPLDTTIYEEESGIPTRLDLIAHYRGEDGGTVAILFRPESVKKHVRERGLLWGALSSGARVPFVLLRQRDPGVTPFVFSGEDGALHPYQWGRDRDFEKEAARVSERFAAFGRSEFSEQIDAYKCDQCDSRIPCPHWLGAVAES